MTIETNIRLAEGYIKKQMYISAQTYLDTIAEQLKLLPKKERKVIDKKYAHFLNLYIYTQYYE